MLPDDHNPMKRALETSGDCPSVEDLAAHLDSRSSQVGTHLAACPRCAAELSLLREFESGAPRPGEAADVRWIQARLREHARPPRLPWWRPSWMSALSLAAATLLIVIAAGISFRRTHEPALGGLRDAPPVLRSGRLGGLSPAGELNHVPAELRWDPVAGASQYEVKLMEVDRTDLWKARSANARIALPSEVASRIVPGKTLLWQVVVFNAAGEKIALSEIERFRLRF